MCVVSVCVCVFGGRKFESSLTTIFKTKKTFFKNFLNLLGFILNIGDYILQVAVVFFDVVPCDGVHWHFMNNGIMLPSTSTQKLDTEENHLLVLRVTARKSISAIA